MYCKLRCNKILTLKAGSGKHAALRKVQDICHELTDSKWSLKPATWTYWIRFPGRCIHDARVQRPTDPAQLQVREQRLCLDHWNGKCLWKILDIDCCLMAGRVDGWGLGRFCDCLTTKKTSEEVIRNYFAERACGQRFYILFNYDIVQLYETTILDLNTAHIQNTLLYLHSHTIRGVSPDDFVDDWLVAQVSLLRSCFAPISEKLFNGCPHFVHVEIRCRGNSHIGILHDFNAVLFWILLVHVRMKPNFITLTAKSLFNANNLVTYYSRDLWILKHAHCTGNDPLDEGLV